MYVRRRLPVRERARMAAQGDALVQLRQVGVEQQLPQLGLPDEHDAEQLARRRLEVEQQPDLLEQLHRQRLRFVQQAPGIPAAALKKPELRPLAPPENLPEGELGEALARLYQGIQRKG